MWLKGSFPFLSLNLGLCIPGDHSINISWTELPWWVSGEESACQRRRQGFNLCPGKTPCAVGQLSLRARTTEPTLWSPGATASETRAARHEKPRRWEAHALQLESNPHSLQLEKSPSSSEDSVQSKINKNF